MAVTFEDDLDSSVAQLEVVLEQDNWLYYAEFVEAGDQCNLVMPLTTHQYRRYSNRTHDYQWI